MPARTRFLLVPTLLMSAACGSSVDVDASETSTGMSSTTAPGDTSGSEVGSTTSSPEASSSSDTGELESSTADTSSSTGDGGTEVSICQYECAVDEDCWQNGAFVGLTCSETGSCLATCETDDLCTATYSGWLAQSCTANDECAGGICVDYGLADGTGGCGLPPSDALVCRRFGLEETDVTDIAGDPAVVCAIEAECSDVEDIGRLCVPIGEFGPNCARDGCDEGLTCRDDGLCGCEDDDACTLSGSEGTCIGGFCLDECTSTKECDLPSPFDGGGFVCSPLELPSVARPPTAVGAGPA